MRVKADTNTPILFRALSEDQVWACLDEPIADNPVAQEVARLVAEYANRPYCLGLDAAPDWPIERVAMQLAENYW